MPNERGAAFDWEYPVLRLTGTQADEQSAWGGAAGFKSGPLAPSGKGGLAAVPIPPARDGEWPSRGNCTPKDSGKSMMNTEQMRFSTG